MRMRSLPLLLLLSHLFLNPQPRCPNLWIKLMDEIDGFVQMLSCV